MGGCHVVRFHYLHEEDQIHSKLLIFIQTFAIVQHVLELHSVFRQLSFVMKNDERMEDA